MTDREPSSSLAAALAAFEFEVAEIAREFGVSVDEARAAYCAQWSRALRAASQPADERSM